MMPSTVHFDVIVHEQNKLGRKLEELRKQRYADLSRVDSIGNEMRETVGLVAEIYGCQLKVIEALLEQSPEERNFKQAVESFHKLVDEVKEENLKCYQSLLDARPGLMEGGQFVKLTPEKKEEMVSDFSKLIGEKIDEKKLCIDEDTNLETLQAAIETAEKTQMTVYQHLLDSKTGVTIGVMSTEAELKSTKAAQAGILSRKQATTIWEASEFGDAAFLQEEIDKLWWWQKEDFVNDNKHGYTLLSLATSQGHLACVTLLLANKANPKVPDQKGYHPLHWAAKTGNKAIGSLLLEGGADIAAQGEYGREPLYMAVWNGHAEFAEWLLGNGANINAQTNRGNGCITALHEAVMREDLLMVVALTKHTQLNVNLADARSQSPLYYAVLLGLSDVAALIVGHPSFKWPTDPADPNHISQLLQIKPGRNVEKIKRFLEHYVG